MSLVNGLRLTFGTKVFYCVICRIENNRPSLVLSMTSSSSRRYVILRPTGPFMCMPAVCIYDRSVGWPGTHARIEFELGKVTGSDRGGLGTATALPQCQSPVDITGSLEFLETGAGVGPKDLPVLDDVIGKLPRPLSANASCSCLSVCVYSQFVVVPRGVATCLVVVCRRRILTLLSPASAAAAA